MATLDTIADRLLRRYKGVPNFTKTDADELVEDAMHSHGYEPTDDVPSDRESLVLLYAQTQAAWQIAFSVAHYFKFTDGEEAVDKSMVAENYRKLAKDSQAEYDSAETIIYGSKFRIMKRLDRPHTTPETGESRRRPWRR